MKKILIFTLSFLLMFSFVPVSADSPNRAEFAVYLDNMNSSGFWWRDYNYTNYNYYGNVFNFSASFSDFSYFQYSTSSYALVNFSESYVGSHDYYCYPVPILSLYVVGSSDSYSCEIELSSSTSSLNSSSIGTGTWTSFLGRSGTVGFTSFNPSTQTCSFTYSISGSLNTVLSDISNKFRNVFLYVNGDLWISPQSDFTIETEIELPCDIQAVDSSFSFFNGGYGVTWKQGQYNWTQTGPLENVTRTMVWTVSYPTVSYVQSLYNQSFIDSTPLDVVRNAFNTVFNSGTSIYDIPEQYRATTNFFINIDSPELGSSYHTSYDSTTQQWALTQNEYSYSLANGYQFNTGFFKQLYQLYGDADLFSIALCYITPVRVSMYAVDDTQGIIYNPLSIYWLDLKQSNGTVLEYRNFGSQTTVTDDNVTDDTTSNDSVTGDDSPFVNPTEEQLNTNYNNSIQNSYNHTVNNYYNYNDINTDLLDYYLSFRDGGTEQDVQDAFGYLNATISSLSNVPVVLHNLFYNFFPLPVLRLMQALFIVFMVFMIIIIIKHLFR